MPFGKSKPYTFGASPTITPVVSQAQFSDQAIDAGGNVVSTVINPVKPTLDDVLTAIKISNDKLPFNAKYDVNGDGKVTDVDATGLNKAYTGVDPGFFFKSDFFASPSKKTAEDYAAEAKANEERIAAEQKETARRQALLADAQKLNGLVSADLVANNPNLNAQQLASLAQRNYWSNESEAFSRVMTGMENGTAQLKEVEVGADEWGTPIKQLVITTGEHTGYDTLYLRPTSQEGVYQFSTPNQVAGGMISGVIQADPKTGKYKPVADYTGQIQYTPGSSGGFFGNVADAFGGAIGSFGDIIKELGPVATIIGNGIMPGLGTALSVAAAIDEGANPADIAKTIAISEGLSQSGLSQNVAESVGSQAAGQLAAGTVGGLLSGQNLETALTGALTNLRPTNQFEAEVNQALDTPATQISGQDLAADSVAGNTVNDVIQQIVQANNVAQDTITSGQDLAADTVAGNTVQDVISNIVNNAAATDTTLISGQDLSADAGNTIQDVITVIANDVTNNLTGQDLAADSVVGNAVTDVVTTLVNDLIANGVTGQDLAADLTSGNTITDVATTLVNNTLNDTLLSGQDLAADSVGGNTIQDVIDILTNDTTVSGQDISADTGTGANTLNDVAIALSSEGDAVSGQDLASDITTGTANTLDDVIQQLIQDTIPSVVAQDALVSGQDLAADSIVGNTLQDVINNLTQDTIQSVLAQDTITDGQDTLLSGQDLAADNTAGNTLQDVINVLNQDTITSGQDLSADTGTGANTLTDISTALAGEGSLISGQDLASDLKTGTANTLDDIAIALAGEGSAITGQDLAADATAGNTLADITNVLTDTKTDTKTDTQTDTTVDDVLNTLSDIAKVAAVVGAGDALVNNVTQTPVRRGFDIVPVPTDWKSPVYNQQFTPVDLTTIFDNLNRLQNTQWATPRVYGGAYQGTPVNISDIVNQIMSSQLTPSTMPSQITNAVGGILGPSTTR